MKNSHDTSVITKESKDTLQAGKQAQEQVPAPRSKSSIAGRPGIAKSIGWILQGGVMLSALVIVLGLLLLPSRPGGLSPERVLAFPQTLSQVGAGVLALRPQAVINPGPLLLLGTPNLRDAGSILALSL